MAKVKNTGIQPRGFILEDGSQVVVKPGEEAEFNMTEADFKNLQKMLENADDPKPYELSGSHGGAKATKEKKEEGSEMPAQSTEPPTPAPTAVPPNQTVLPAEQERRQQQAAAAKKEQEHKK
jgi:hypothetical protein